MPRIDLYLLKGSNFSEQVEFCCRLIEKARPHHSQIHIQTLNSIQNEAIDTTLWSFKPDSFLPHEIALADSSNCPITIHTDFHPKATYQDDLLLILLGKSLPENLSSLARLCFVVPNIESEVQDARIFYKNLKQQGHEVHIHDLRK